MNLPETIALIGYRGTGKSTVARLLASRVGFEWVDADDQIEQRAGMAIAQIFSDSGEQAFRDIETEIVTELCLCSRTVVALGGGAVLREENRQRIAQCGAVVWLIASAATIEKRLVADAATAERRPNLTNRGGRNEIEQLLLQRTPIYRACATLEVDTEVKTPTEITDEIVAALGLAD